MASWHALTGDSFGNAFRIVMHFPIPAAGTNRAGVQWRVALANSGLARTVLPDGNGSNGTIAAAEKADILAGAVYEHVEEVATNPGETDAQYRDRIIALHAARQVEVLARLQKALTYFGYTQA
jgi:hypothetical protein